MENLVYHARRMVEESDMAEDAKMEVLDFLNLDDILALKEYRKLGTVDKIKMCIKELEIIKEYIYPLKNFNTHNEYLEKLKQLVGQTMI